MGIVDRDGRCAVIAALTDLASSDDYRDRADAGQALAAFAGDAESRCTLLRLVLDDTDTFVTRTTAEALLRRQDSAGFAIVAEALGAANPQQRQHIDAAVRIVFLLFASDRDHAVAGCESLMLASDEPVRRGARALREMLTSMSPMLYPQEPG